jgi:hypothetical protein
MDFTYTVVNDLIFAALELELGIVVANLPLMRPLMRKAFGSSGALGSIWKRSDNSKNYTEKSVSARDRYYGNHSQHSAARKKSLHDSIDGGRGVPQPQVPGDRYPFDEHMSTASTVRDHSSLDLESQTSHEERRGNIHVRDDVWVERSMNEDYAQQRQEAQHPQATYQPGRYRPGQYQGISM